MKQVTAGKWSYQLKAPVRDAIRTEDPAEVVKAILQAYKELRDEGLIDEDDFESYTEDFEMYLDRDMKDYDEDDAEELVDYELDNLYDLCDNIRVWIPMV